MNFGDLVETRVDQAVEDSGKASVAFKDAIHAAIKAFIENLVAVFSKLFGGKAE